MNECERTKKISNKSFRSRAPAIQAMPHGHAACRSRKGKRTRTSEGQSIEGIINNTHFPVDQAVVNKTAGTSISLIIALKFYFVFVEGKTRNPNFPPAIEIPYDFETRRDSTVDQSFKWTPQEG